jgi:hypothetical protein
MQTVKLTTEQWRLVLQSVNHRVRQTPNPKLHAELQEVEAAIDRQVKV